MELFTHNPLQNFSLPLYLEECPKQSRNCVMLKILYAEAGCEMEVLGKNVRLSSPSIICLNQDEPFKVHGIQDITLWALYLSPAMVNSAFTMENINGDISHLAETVVLDHYLFKPFLRNHDMKAEWIWLDALSESRLLALKSDLRTQMENLQDHFWPCRNRSKLIELLILIHHCHHQKMGAMPDQMDNISDVLHYMNLHYTEKITIDTLCRLFGTNRNTLSNRFRETTGHSIVAFLVKIRMDAACRLLRETMLPVAEIAEQVGFSDLSYWGRAFKKFMGATPLAYRKAYQNRS